MNVGNQYNNRIIPNNYNLNISQHINRPTDNNVDNSNKILGRLIPSQERIGHLKENYNDKELKKLGVIECTTCANRAYQDVSDDSSVSMQTPTKLKPSEAASAVMSHEMEHVVNEQAKARNEGREVISQSVQIHTSICPECGVVYVSGGVTKTTTAGKANPYENDDEKAIGNLLDFKL